MVVHCREDACVPFARVGGKQTRKTTAPSTLSRFAFTLLCVRDNPVAMQKVCPLCGANNKGIPSCCGVGGAWRGRCGKEGSSKPHTWDEGLETCAPTTSGEISNTTNSVYQLLNSRCAEDACVSCMLCPLNLMSCCDNPDIRCKKP